MVPQCTLQARLHRKGERQLLVDNRTLQCEQAALAAEGMESSSRIGQIFRNTSHGW
jgi:hypothetical protein